MGNNFTDRLDTHQDRASRLRNTGARARLDLCSRDGSVALWIADYPSYTGSFAYSDRLNIYMGVKGSGRMVRRSDAQALDASFHPGRVGLSVPGTAGEGGWDRLSLMGLGVDLARLTLDDGTIPAPDRFATCASRLHDDPLLASVLTAMRREAEMHGLVSAFFEHGLMLVANRLLAAPPSWSHPVRALSASELRLVTDRIEQSLASDLSVAELAAMTGMSRQYFSRAFKAATGYPPYAYLTLRRVERAKEMLADGNVSVTSVALSVGFTNPSQFAAAFRRVTGFTPVAWRRLG